MISCAKAERLVRLARENGWTATTDYGPVEDGTPEYVDVQLTTTYKHPDSGEGWEIGAMCRWYSVGGRRSGWRLGALDEAGKRVVGGVAERTLGDLALSRIGGREIEFWLFTLRALEGYVRDVGALADWLDSEVAA